MVGIARSIKRRLLTAVEPRGKSELHDGILLKLWEGYALLRGTMAWLAEKDRRKAPIPSAKEKALHIKIRYDGDFFRRHITEHLLPFWERHSVDHTYGGFITHLDREGKIYDDTTKFSPMQGRMIYAFSVGHEIQDGSHYLQLAKQGFNFLVEKFWDDRFGGWYRSVYRDGPVKNAEKYLYDQAYVLTGLIEYYRVTGDESARRYITETCEALNRHAWDERYLGYYERCARDWTVVSSKKTICVHSDMLAALLSLSLLDKQKAYFDRLRQVADLIVGRMCDKKYGCVLEKFHRNWLYNPLVSRDRIQFGHNLKAAWLLLETYRLTGDLSYFECASRLLDYCIDHGWDKRNQGFYQHAFRNGVLAAGEKLWWPECEGISALLFMHKLTSDALYLDYFRRLTDFAFTHFFDSEHGEWFSSCHADGSVKDSRKGYEWKAAFHTVEACLHAYRLLEESDQLKQLIEKQ